MNSQGIAKGKFGEWLLKRMLENGYNYHSLASKVDTYPRRIDANVRHIICPSFQMVVTYCWAFGMIDNPEEINELVKEDWDL